MKVLLSSFLCLALAAELSSFRSFAAEAKPPRAAPTQSRQINHKKAYDKRPERGEHISIKVTPPEKRGAEGMFLVEIWNYSKKTLSVLEFDIEVMNRGAFSIKSQISAEDMTPGWSAPKWIRIPGKGKLPIIESVAVTNLRAFDEKAKAVTIPHYVDLIKE